MSAHHTLPLCSLHGLSRSLARSPRSIICRCLFCRRRSALLAHRASHGSIHAAPTTKPSPPPRSPDDEKDRDDQREPELEDGTRDADKENVAVPVPSSTSASPRKRLRLLPSAKKAAPPLPSTSSLFRPPPPPSPSSTSALHASASRYLRCLYAARSKKKHRVWADGLLHVHGRRCCLYAEDSKVVVRTLATVSTEGWTEGAMVEVGNWEMELCAELSEETFLSGRCFIGLEDAPSVAPPPPRVAAAAAPQKPFASPTVTRTSTSSSASRPPPAPAAPSTQFGLYDLTDPSLLVLNRADLSAPSSSSSSKGKASAPRAVPVIVESFISRELRPHQVEGVQFLYDCIIGRANPPHTGAILADEMGLGKTLQSIALLYTLLRGGPHGAPVIRKCVVVCPSTLVSNWLAEFAKWLGRERLRAMGVDAGQSKEEQTQNVSAFVAGTANHVLVLSYELFRRHVERLRPLRDALFVCDEGHRLKNSKGNATISALQSVASKRRLILTGTPVQNDLMEFFAMIDFVNPAVLGALHTFRHTFEAPIQRSRDSSSSPEDKQLGEARSAELSRLTSSFVLRRTADVLRKYLPPKTELVLFCRMTPLQRDVYAAALKISRKQVQPESAMSAQREALALQCIQTLRTISNHPALYYPRCLERGQEEDDELHSVFTCFPAEYGASAASSEAESGKTAVLMALLEGVQRERGKVVVVSNYTETLNMLQALCEGRHWRTLRLDGGVAGDKRQQLVDRFNSAYNTDERIFLLSAKAGGQGLNLIGGNRLVLFDPDWNPATDLQAMARIWRDGQPLPCFIYRLLSAASIDEKMYQRQLRKQEVAGTVVDQGKGGARGGAGPSGGGHERVFDSRTLREVFKYRGTSDCETYEVLTHSRASERTTRGAASSTAAERGSQVVVSGKRWACVWDSQQSDDTLVRAVPPGAVSCVWSRLSTSDDREEVTAIIGHLIAEDEDLPPADDESAPEGQHQQGGDAAEQVEEEEDTRPPALRTQRRGRDDSDGEEGEEDADDETAAGAPSNDSIEEDDDAAADWKRDIAEAQRAKRDERRAKRRAEALRLAQEDARMLLDAGDADTEDRPPPPSRATARRRIAVEDDSDEDEFMAAAQPAPSPASQKAVNGEGDDEEAMRTIQALVNAPPPLSTIKQGAATGYRAPTAAHRPPQLDEDDDEDDEFGI